MVPLKQEPNAHKSKEPSADTPARRRWGTNGRANMSWRRMIRLSTIWLILNMVAAAASNVAPSDDASADSAIGDNSKGLNTPQVPFCRAGAVAQNMWLPVWDHDSQRIVTAKRIVVFGGKGMNYDVDDTPGVLTYLGDMWALHITNTGFHWIEVIPSGKYRPSDRWQTGSTVAFDDRSLVVYGGDDQTTSEIGALGDLWMFSPKNMRDNRLDEWQYIERGGDVPGQRREPAMTLINSTLILQGGKMRMGESDEACDPRLFLLDVANPIGQWHQGRSLPSDCGVGHTMDSVVLPNAKGNKRRAMVFGGCQYDMDGMFTCSNDLFAYDPRKDLWEEIVPESDADASSCESNSEAGNDGVDGGDKNNKPTGACPGRTRARPLGRHGHATAYIESQNTLYVHGGRENENELAPLGDLWVFDFSTLRWHEIVQSSGKAPSNRFAHSLTVWAGGAGDGSESSLVAFGGQTINRFGDNSVMNDVWLFRPGSGDWREVSRSDCKQGASGQVRGGQWTALYALAALLVLVVVVQVVLHHVCPNYQPPVRRSLRRRRRKRPVDPNAQPSASSSATDGGADGEKGEATTSSTTLLASSSNPGANGQTAKAESYQSI